MDILEINMSDMFCIGENPIMEITGKKYMKKKTFDIATGDVDLFTYEFMTYVYRDGTMNKGIGTLTVNKRPCCKCNFPYI